MLEVFDRDIFHMGGDEVFFQCWYYQEQIRNWQRAEGSYDLMDLWGMFQEKGNVMAIWKLFCNRFEKWKEIFIFNCFYTFNGSFVWQLCSIGQVKGSKLFASHYSNCVDFGYDIKRKTLSGSFTIHYSNLDWLWVIINFYILWPFAELDFMQWH